ncbi:MAG: hypothetical protein KDB28_15510, partial [Tetrasphaera sp.]|nr:hypothetical protein [Tetrasphaera sp.]
VSQSVTGFGVEGQGWDEAIANQEWQTAADVCVGVTEALLADLPAEPVVVNLNVPNVPLDQITEWRETQVGAQPPRSMSAATLEPKPGHEGTFSIRFAGGAPVDLPPGTDGGTVERGIVAVSYLSRLEHVPRDDMGAAQAALDALFPS